MLVPVPVLVPVHVLVSVWSNCLCSWDDISAEGARLSVWTAGELGVDDVDSMITFVSSC